MKYLKILIILPFILTLCGCTSKDYGQLDELGNSIINDLQKDGVVTNCDCPDIYAKSIIWSTLLYEQKQTIGKLYVTKCQSPVTFKDAHNGKNLMKCKSVEYNAKCKLYD